MNCGGLLFLVIIAFTSSPVSSASLSSYREPYYSYSGTGIIIDAAGPPGSQSNYGNKGVIPKNYDGVVFVQILGAGVHNIAQYFCTLALQCEAKRPDLWKQAEDDLRLCFKEKSQLLSLQNRPPGNVGKACEVWKVRNTCYSDLSEDLNECHAENYNYNYSPYGTRTGPQVSKKGSEAFSLTNSMMDFICRNPIETENNLLKKYVSMNNREVSTQGGLYCFERLETTIKDCVRQDTYPDDSFCDKLETVSVCFSTYYTDKYCDNRATQDFVKKMFRHLDSQLKCEKYGTDPQKPVVSVYGTSVWGETPNQYGKAKQSDLNWQRGPTYPTIKFNDDYTNYNAKPIQPKSGGLMPGITQGQTQQGSYDSWPTYGSAYGTGTPVSQGVKNYGPYGPGGVQVVAKSLSGQASTYDSDYGLSTPNYPGNSFALSSGRSGPNEQLPPSEWFVQSSSRSEVIDNNFRKKDIPTAETDEKEFEKWFQSLKNYQKSKNRMDVYDDPDKSYYISVGPPKMQASSGIWNKQYTQASSNIYNPGRKELLTNANERLDEETYQRKYDFPKSLEFNSQESYESLPIAVVRKYLMKKALRSENSRNRVFMSS